MQSNCGDSLPPSSVNGETLTLLTLNASHGRNLAWNQMLVSTERIYENLDLIATVLDETKADVVALQEADAPSKWSGKFDHVAYLRDKTGYECSLLGEHADSWLYSFGTALLSYAAMQNSVSVTFPGSPPTTTKGFVMTSINWDYGDGLVPVTFLSVHLDFSRKSVRDLQVSMLIDALRDVAPPILIMGDINSHWEQNRSHVRQLSEKLGLIVYEPESTELGTYGDTSGKRLDWILASPELEFLDYRVLPQQISDHLAVYAEFAPKGPSQ